MENLVNVAPVGNTRSATQKKKNNINALMRNYRAITGRSNSNMLKRRSFLARISGAKSNLARLERSETRKSLRNKGVSEYIVIKANTLDEIQTDVMKKLAEGYSLQGGVSVSSSQESSVYHQAMIKANKPKNLLANNTNLLTL